MADSAGRGIVNATQSASLNKVCSKPSVQLTTEVGESEGSDGFEQIILKLGDCFVFKIPPLRSASGHRAESWDLEKPLFIGYLQIYQNDKKLCVRIYKFKNTYSKTPTDDNLTFFAECPVEIQPKESVTAYIDTVVDSSRYFVLKMKDRATGRTAQMGIGFLDRDPAFEFKNCLNEYIRYVSRMNVAAGGAMNKDVEGVEDGMHSFNMDNQDDDDDNDDGEENNSPEQSQSSSSSSSSSSLKQSNNNHNHNHNHDLSIQPGAKIKIKSLGVHRTIPHHTSDDDGKNKNEKSSSIGLLAPPPISKSILLPPPSEVDNSFSVATKSNIGSSNTNNNDDDAWGDFETA